MQAWLSKNGKTLLLSLLLGIPLALIGAKAVYLLNDLGAELSMDFFRAVTNLQPESLSFAGGCLGFTAGVALAALLSGMRVPETLDAFAVPGCILVFAARCAEYWMGSVGRGNPVGDGFPVFFPLTVRDSWGDPCLAVFALEALTALLCALWLCLTRRKPAEAGMRFQRAVIVLCGAQLFWDMLLCQWLPFIISFVHLDQVVCAVVLLVLAIRVSLRRKNAWPAVITGVMLGLNAFLQYFQDKPYLFTQSLSESAERWIYDHLSTIALIGFAVSSVCIIVTGLRTTFPPESSENAPEK